MNIHPSPPLPNGLYSNKKDSNSPLEYLETANTPYNKDSEI